MPSWLFRREALLALAALLLAAGAGVARVLDGSGAPLAPPLALRLLDRLPLLQRPPARLVGLGFRPEHVRTQDVQAVP